MSRTVPSASRGGKVAPLALCTLIVWTVAVAAQPAYESGAEAYAERDWEAAEQLWRDAAETGSPEALLGLGNLYDFGLVGPADPQRAFDLYKSAARLGSAEAAFNVAVMLDSGVGTELDRRSAAAWYGFAAVGGHARAQYNLGILFADGDGVTQNTALASYWLRRARDEIPAAGPAADALGAADPKTLSKPIPLGAELVETGGGHQIRLAWDSEGGPSDALFRVELIALPDEVPGAVVHAETEASAAGIAVRDDVDEFAWRVLQIGGTPLDYSASDWLARTGEVMDIGRSGTVRFGYSQKDRRAQSLALRLGGALERGGLRVEYAQTLDTPDNSSVTYRFESDTGLAADIGAFVPGFTSTQVSQDAEIDLAPAEILVQLVFGPDINATRGTIQGSQEAETGGSPTD